MSQFHVLSHSFTTELLECPRKFQLSEHSLEVRTSRSPYISAAFGSVFGIAIAEYLHSGDVNEAILKAFVEWNFPLDEVQVTTGRSVWNIVHAMQDLHRFGILADHKPLELDGKNDWREVPFVIVHENCAYAGTIDQAFTIDGIPTVVDFKTGDKPPPILEIKYANQDQLLAYAIMFGTAYNLPRIAYQYDLYSIPSGVFSKIHKEVTKEMASEWIGSIYARFEMLRIFESLPKAPKNGRACFNFSKPCQFYGTCDDLQKAPLAPAIPDYYTRMTLEDVKNWIENVLEPEGSAPFVWSL